MQALYAVLIAVVLFALVIVSYYLNKKTPVPEGCENLHPDCKGCGITSCAIRNDMMKKIEEELDHGDN